MASKLDQNSHSRHARHFVGQGVTHHLGGIRNADAVPVGSGRAKQHYDANTKTMNLADTHPMSKANIPENLIGNISNKYLIIGAVVVIGAWYLYS